MRKVASNVRANCVRVCCYVCARVSGISKKYSETVVPRLIKSACEILDEDAETLMEAVGARFPIFVGARSSRSYRGRSRVSVFV